MGAIVNQPGVLVEAKGQDPWFLRIMWLSINERNACSTGVLRMVTHGEVAVGLDVGTSGVRAVAVDFDGRVVAGGRAELPDEATHRDGPVIEQEPRAWIAAARAALQEMVAALPSACRVVGIAVDATSGTFLLADENLRPLTRGIMYNDLRAVERAPEADEAVRDVLHPYGIRIAPAFALTKLFYFARREPQQFNRCRHVVHQTDWVIGWLCGRYDVTDVSTALKTGADPGRLAWPDTLESQLGISKDLLPEIVLPGTRIGEVTTAAAEATGLAAGVPVVAGCTDGTAGCLASGAKSAGDLNVTLGTTLVFKAVADAPVIDPEGTIYNHRHPAGGFLPGAASSTGADWVGQHFPDADLDALGCDAAGALPTRRVVYPLVKTGERFPFARPMATGFGLSDVNSPVERLAAGMEGVALLERLGIERLERLGLPIGPTVYATGGGVASRTWLKIRAAVNRRNYSIPAEPECAVGAAVLAAMPHLGGCHEAVAALVRAGAIIEPDSVLAEAYDEQFAQFRNALKQRGYL
jgi:sugar (pentulose or hexulose) kinase